MPYPFDQIFAADPDNTEMVASNVGVLIFAPGDASKAPLPLTTLTGIPLANPVPVNDKGFGPAFMADLDQVAWEGGGHTGLFASYKGIKDEAVAARQAAEDIRAEVQAPADDAVDRGIQRANIPGLVSSGVRAEITPLLDPTVKQIASAYIASNPAVVSAAAAAVDANPKIVELDKKIRPTKDLTSGADLNTVLGATGNGTYRLLSTNIANTPGAFVGYLESYSNGTDGRTTQIFTRSTPGSLSQYSRTYSGGAWSEWAPSVWNAGLLRTGIDWNTLKAPAVYGIQFTNHPNQAAPVIGTLEVLPSSGNVVQRFTEDAPPHNVWTRRFSGSAWSAFTRSNSTSTPQAPVEGFALPVRGKLQPEGFSASSKNASQIVASLSNDRTRGWNQNTSALSETMDDGRTWRAITDKDGLNPFAGSTIEAVKEMANGEVLICCLRGTTSRREVWVSRNMRDNTSRTFTRTMEARAPFIKFTPGWSISTHESVVLLNEYGPKTPTWDGQPVTSGENARYTYLSMDSGLTWSTIFDLNAYLTDTQKRTSLDGQHLHGVAWDEYWDRIWVTFGDNLGGNGSNGIVYSDDLGATWQTAHFYSGSTAPHQVVGIQPMPKCVLFYGDMGPDVVRIDRAEGKRKVGGYATPVAFDSTAEGKHLCQGFARIKRPGDDAPALAAFSAEGAQSPSFAIATLDGYTFTEFWRDTVANPSGMGARSIVGPTLRGEVVISSNDLKVAGSWSEVRAPAPGY